MLLKKKRKRVFNVKIIATGFMSNKYIFFEFTGHINDWELKHNGPRCYAWYQMPLDKRWGLEPKDFEFIVIELEKGE